MLGELSNQANKGEGGLRQTSVDSAPFADEGVIFKARG